MQSVKLISITKHIDSNIKNEELIAYIARVSSNLTDDKKYDNNEKLIRYCIDHKHWSIFEHSFMTVEIKTSRMISAQLIRHRSFTFQEFSQRYATADNFIIYGARRQDLKNRQNSIDDLPQEIKKWFHSAQEEIWDICVNKYNEAIDKGIAKECARALLPLNTSTVLYMSGNLRSWIHYINLRSDQATQLEHRDIALECKKILIEQFPMVLRALE